MIDFGIQKICAQCGKGKPLSEYSPKKGGKDGLQPACKTCRAKNARVSRNGADKYAVINYPVEDGLKRCGDCNELKELDRFVTRPGIGDGFYRICKDCMNDKSKKWQKENPEAKKLSTRKTNLKRYFNMTLTDYETMLADQGGGCAICGATKGAPHRETLYVDHNHETGRVRGLLCGGCNSALGFLKDDPELVKNAAAYIMGER